MKPSADEEGSKPAASDGDQQSHEIKRDPDKADASPQPPKSQNADTKPNDPNPKSYESVIALWTTILGISTVILAIATGISAYFLWLTNRTMQDTLVATQRPWLVVKATPAAALIMSERQLNALIKFTIKNVGRSPATNISFTASIIPSFQTVDGAIESQGDSCVYTYHPKYTAIGHTLFPDEELSTVRSLSLARDTVQKILSGRDTAINPSIIVCVVYRSAFNIRNTPGVEESHKTTYAGEIRHASPTLSASGVTMSLDFKRSSVPASELVIFPTIGGMGNYAN